MLKLPALFSSTEAGIQTSVPPGMVSIRLTLIKITAALLSVPSVCVLCGQDVRQEVLSDGEEK